MAADAAGAKFCATAWRHTPPAVSGAFAATVTSDPGGCCASCRPGQYVGHARACIWLRLHLHSCVRVSHGPASLTLVAASSQVLSQASVSCLCLTAARKNLKHTTAYTCLLPGFCFLVLARQYVGLASVQGRGLATRVGSRARLDHTGVSFLSDSPARTHSKPGTSQAGHDLVITPGSVEHALRSARSSCPSSAACAAITSHARRGLCSHAPCT